MRQKGAVRAGAEGEEGEEALRLLKLRHCRLPPNSRVPWPLLPRTRVPEEPPRSCQSLEAAAVRAAAAAAAAVEGTREGTAGTAAASRGTRHTARGRTCKKQNVKGGMGARN